MKNTTYPSDTYLLKPEKHQNNVHDVILVSPLLTFEKFYTLF